jgi:hypothetical protein
MAKFIEVTNLPGHLMFDCPGCGFSHEINTYVNTGEPVWSFNGNLAKPTVTPSILVRFVSHPGNAEMDGDEKYVLGDDGRLKGAKDEVCHSFITDGKIQFLSDCTHSLAGQTVELPEFL